MSRGPWSSWSAAEMCDGYGGGMSERVEIPHDGDGLVHGTFAPGGTGVGVLLAPGAGAGQDHPFMVAVRSGLAARGLTTLSFDYAYRSAGRKAPERLPKLLDVHEAAYLWLAGRVERVVLAGKSMGGRVGSHLAGGVEAEEGRTGRELAGLVYLGYPLVAIGKTEPRSVEHLRRIVVPQLFVAGTRDRLAPLSLIQDVAGSLTDATVHVIDEADHGFHVPKRTGRHDSDVLEEIVEVAAAFVAQASGGT